MATLRNFDQMWSAYPCPGGPASAAKEAIGGRVNQPAITNTCVVRVSRSFNYSGNLIPNRSSDEIVTVPGADGKQYALRVREFTRYLKRKYGRSDLEHDYPEPGGGPVPPQLQGRQGVIIFEVEGWSDATGHADLWDGAACRHSSCFNRASRVMLWLVDDAAPSHRLDGSVGVGGQNRKADVELVQTLLTARGLDPGPIDGRAGPRTNAAIRTFQADFLGRPDGRIDVDGRSWRELQGL